MRVSNIAMIVTNIVKPIFNVIIFVLVLLPFSQFSQSKQVLQ